MKSRFTETQLITLGTYGFEQQFLIRNGYKVLQRHRINGASYVLAQRKKVRMLFQVRIIYKDKLVVDSIKRTRNDLQNVYRSFIDRAKTLGAIPALCQFDFDEDVNYLIENQKYGKFSFIEVDGQKIYMSEPISKLEYRTSNEKHQS
jgi:hypothetical protein